MKNYLIKSAFILLPFVIIHLLNTTFYSRNEGDLVRMGYLYSNPCPKSLINEPFEAKRKYTLLSELNLNKKHKFNIVTIGDSFSNSNHFSYQNFLSDTNITILNYDKFLIYNPIQNLIELMNGNFFDSIQTDYIILQSVEREIIPLIQKNDFRKKLSLDTIQKQINEQIQIQKSKKTTQSIDFFSNATIKIPLTNIEYLYKTLPRYSQTYKFTATTNQLFSNNPSNLLIFEADIRTLGDKNNFAQIDSLHKVLTIINSMLAAKNIKLIVLISPDKYDLYYPSIENKIALEKPLFFEYYNKLSKSYIDIPAYTILSKEIKNQKDIYYYNDTHWSPIAAQIIAAQIKKAFSENQ